MPSETTPWGETNLDRALAAMKASIPERLLIQHVREQRSPCVVNISRLARDAGIDRANLSHARTDLLRDRVLVASGGGVAFNPDPGTWAEGRITRAALAFAAAPIGRPPRERPAPAPSANGHAPANVARVATEGSRPAPPPPRPASARERRTKDWMEQREALRKLFTEPEGGVP